MEVIFSAWQWVPWLMGFGAVGWIALAIFAPSILLILTPALQGIAQGAVEFIKVMYAGVVNILSAWQSVAAVALAIFVAISYGQYKERHRADVTPLIQQEAPTTPTVVRPTHRTTQSKRTIVVPSVPSVLFPRSSAPNECSTCEGSR